MKLIRMAPVLTAAIVTFAPPAFAQTSAAPAMVEIEEDDLIVAPLNVTVDDLEDMDVVSADGEDIGDVEEVLGGADGQAAALALEVGGFLGVGERDVIVPLDQVTMQGDDLVLDMTQEEVEALPVWDD